MPLPNFEVNITSYKYPGMVNSLAKQIHEKIPGAFIRVWDSSPEKQEFIGVDEIRWHRFNPSLSRVWNWAIAQSEGEWVWVSNDDIRLLPRWHEFLEKAFAEFPKSLWHGPSRCFLYNKKLLDLVGWFDERMLGFSSEDRDYIRRMNYAKVEHNYGGKSELNRFASSLKGEIRRGDDLKFSNIPFFNTKYDNPGLEDFDGVPNFPTPDFYPERPR
jgi:hypothetical protein